MRINHLFVLLLVFVGTARAQFVDFSSIKGMELIGKNATYLYGVDPDYSLQEIIIKQNDFVKQEEVVFSKPATSGVTWVYFEGGGQVLNDLWLDVHNSNLTYVSVYKLDQNNVVLDAMHSGAMERNRSVVMDNSTFLFPLFERNQNEKYHFYIRVRTRIAVEIPMFVGSLNELNKNAYRDNFMGLFFIGSVLILFLYNIFFFFNLRKRIYLYYSLHLISILFVGPYFNNFPIIEDILGPNITHNYASLWTWFPLWTSAVFSIEYLRLRNEFPKFRKLLLAMVGIYVITIPIVFISPNVFLVRFYILVTVLFYIVALVMGYYIYFKKKSRQSLLFCIGWTALVIGIVLLVLVRNGVIPYSLFWRNISYFGSFIESLVFAIGVGQYMNDLRLEEIKLNEELKLSNKELTNLNESLDSFNYHVSHDLKTVLNNTKALTSMIQKYNKKGNSSKVDEVADKLFSVAENGAETVQSFLSLGKIDSLFDKEEADVVNLVDMLNKTIELHAIKQQIDVDVIINQVDSVKMHRKAVESIFLNLMSNTIKYSDSHPKCEFYFLKDEESVSIIYRDYGIGIDTSIYADLIFKPFERGGANPTTEGTGIGLYILHRIVTNYGGTIKLDSKLGEGVKFTMVFPID